MKKYLFCHHATVVCALLLVTILFSSATVLAAGGSANFLRIERDFSLPQPELFVPNEFIVVLTPEASAQVGFGQDRFNMPTASATSLQDIFVRSQVVQFTREFPAAQRQPLVSNRPDLTGHYIVTIKSSTDLEQVMADFAQDPNVDHVEKIGIHVMYPNCATGTATVANDTYYRDPPETFPYDQWDLWDTWGIDAEYSFTEQTGDATVVVVAMDSGVRYVHRDLGGANPPGPNDNSTDGNVWVNSFEIPGNGIDDEGNGYIDDVIGWDFVTGFPTSCRSDLGEDCDVADNDPADHFGHGTHVAGTMAAISNNSGGVAGIVGGWGEPGNGCKIMSLKIGYTYGNGNYVTGVVRMDWAAQAMYYIADMVDRGINVAAVNASWGSSNSGGIDAAVDNLLAHDVMLVHAAGNSNSSSADYLGAKAGVMNVAATDQNGYRASFSNYGSWVDIAAPGVAIISTYHAYEDPTGDYVSVMDGTSMAAPHVAACAALLESQDPSLTGAQKFDTLVKYVCPANSPDIGSGILNAKKALDAIGPGCDVTADFTATPTSDCAPMAVQFTDISTGPVTSWSWTFGDGGTSPAENPSHTYTAAGTYTVTLTATSAACSDTETKTGYIVVSAPPVADLIGVPLAGDAPLTVNFTDLSTGVPTGWSWTFGDGGTSPAKNPSYTYTAPGTYTVSLTVSNPCGNDTHTETDYITVTEGSVQNVHVSALTVTRQPDRHKYYGQASVTVVDEGGTPVVGATVSGFFNAPDTRTKSGVTNSSGVATINSKATPRPPADWCYEVTNVSAVKPYEPGANVVTKACESGPVFANGIVAIAMLPEATGLAQNSPNPFNAQTRITYQVAAADFVSLEVYNVLGSRVTTLAHGWTSEGEYSVIWDGRDSSGKIVASGTYFYRLNVGGQSYVKPMTLLK